MRLLSECNRTSIAMSTTHLCQPLGDTKEKSMNPFGKQLSGQRACHGTRFRYTLVNSLLLQSSATGIYR